MKIKILLLLTFFAFSALPPALATAVGPGYNANRQARKMMPNKVNKRNKKALKKWGLAQTAPIAIGGFVPRNDGIQARDCFLPRNDESGKEEQRAG